MQSPASLRIPPDQLSKIQITKRSQGVETTISIENHDGHWRITSPISYEAYVPLVEPMVAVFAEVEVLTLSSDDGRKAQSSGLTAHDAIQVKGWVGNRLASHFWIGHSSRHHTLIKRPDDPRILTVQGRCRPLFDRTVDELRHPVITDIPMSTVASVSYVNMHGTMVFSASPSGEIRFDGRPIPNFDHDRATQNIAVLTGLRAKGFVDSPDESTGLFAPDTPQATIRLKSPANAQDIRIWIGSRTQDGRIHLRTSLSKQVYLVSGHLESSLIPRRHHFERSEELMKELRLHESNKISHAHGAEAPSQVPQDLLKALRTLAKEQATSLTE